MRVFFLIICLFITALAVGDHPTAQLSVSQSDIESFFNTLNVKMVFVEDTSLYYVDFSENPLVFHKISSINHRVIAPNISNDGKWVTYASNADTLLSSDLTNSSAIRSSAYICELAPDAEPILITADYAHVPRFVKGSDQLDIVYSSIGIWDAWDKKEGEVRRQNISTDGSKQGSEEVVYDGFAMYGGLSHPDASQKQYCGTAIGSSGGAWMVEITGSGAPVQLHKLRLKTSATASSYEEVAAQVCNPSITSSRVSPDAMMYLDFGSGGKYHNFINNNESPWDVHQLFFIGNYSGNVVKYFTLPSDIEKITIKEAGEHKNTGEEGGAIVATSEITWEYPEWSNHPYFAVSSVQTDRLWWKGGSYVGDPSSDFVTRQRNEYIYGINLKTSDKIRLIHTSDTLHGRTTSYQWPWLWIETEEDFQEDAQWLPIKKPANKFRKQSVSKPALALSGKIITTFDGQMISSTAAITRIELHNMVGRIMHTYTPSGTSVKSMSVSDAFSVKTGVYFIRVETSEGTADVFRWVVSAVQ
jgi:hypothetical protein